MAYEIRMGIPEMKALWDSLSKKHKNGTANKMEEELYNKWRNALKKISENPTYPGLKSHEVVELSRRYGVKVWQSYLENKRSGARRMFWVYGPGKQEITIIGLEPHPEDKKNGAYDRINLSDIG